jgi:hypothetical protein
MLRTQSLLKSLGKQGKNFRSAASIGAFGYQKNY